MLKQLRRKLDTLKHDKNYKRECLKICFIYLFIGFIWIYFSDHIINFVFDDHKTILKLHTYKGLFYVFLTAVVLYYLISGLLKQVESTEKKLNESYDELSAANEELQAYVQQLTASEEELRSQYDQIVEFDKMLSLSEEKYKGLITQMQLGLALYEGKKEDDIYHYKLVETNYSHEVLTGLKQDEILGKYFYEVLGNLEPEHVEQLMHTILTGESTRYERFQNNTNYYYEIIAYRPKEFQLAVIVNDITKRKLAEEQTKISENNFRNLFEYSPDSIFLLSDDKIINCNSAVVHMFGAKSRDEIIGKSPMEFTPNRQPDGALSMDRLNGYLDECLKNGKNRFEWWNYRGDGSLMPNDIMMTMIKAYDKNIIYAVCRDISDRKQMEERLHYLSYHDQLTDLYNRRFFEDELLRMDIEENYPLTLTMADINGLKLVNDSFGHIVGDKYIQKVSKVLKEGFRQEDILCRLAGDEFIIISPNTQEEEIKDIIIHIKELSKNEEVNSVNISISFGYCTKNKQEESIQEVLKKAEDYMYKKKLLESPSMRGKTIYTIMAALHEKNPREEEHSHRVSQLCERMGKAMNLPDDEVRELKTVGLLHDIGKVAIEEGILNKNGKLNDEEWEEIKKHPEIGYRILSTVNELSEMAEYVLAHHERWDGSGYPKGLKGEEIPIQSRIIAVVDAYDAMISERSYHKAKSKEYAINELKSGVGSQFSEECVNLFIEKVAGEIYD
ncbi:PAS domain S-box-containing protein/diguanylate cyclase (GGDEF)-like protein [Lachnotalea glycerini]|uniref:Diguanylate cyclase n=1 Tax=Lachnotalea glycerini TaxID=1763509 RepID=A0A255IC34_9FIRM|nr:HD domain-containing phosphohydrolase [Lachnotalea glycerini]PXV85050.1 PAS domain S-box-containing protein/diguanylate cyclase (GGDEF)-like protein [Lachnotalea glycerini]RDY27242.1 diguanylate cyclase [Lachnotalea glycerini]